MPAFDMARLEAAPAIRQVRILTQHEGEGYQYQTLDGGQRQTDYLPIHAESNFSAEDILRDGLVGAVNRMRDMGTEIGHQQEAHLFEMANKATAEVGNVIDAGGKPMTLELFIDCIDMISIDFDEETGNPKLPTFYVHPDQGDSVRSLIEESQQNHELKKRFDAVIERKREEWREREDYRQLVD